MRYLLAIVLLSTPAWAGTLYQVSNWSGQAVVFRLDVGEELAPQSVTATVNPGQMLELDGGDTTGFLLRPYYASNWTEYAFTPKYPLNNRLEVRVMNDDTVLLEQGRTNTGYFMFGFEVAAGLGLMATALRVFTKLGTPSPDL